MAGPVPAIQYSRASVVDHRRSGILGHPLSRVMTVPPGVAATRHSTPHPLHRVPEQVLPAGDVGGPVLGGEVVGMVGDELECTSGDVVALVPAPCLVRR